MQHTILAEIDSSIVIFSKHGFDLVYFWMYLFLNIYLWPLAMNVADLAEVA